MTLRELCERQQVSRRAVQGYEALGLVKPAGRNKMGYLLYGEREEERVHLIRKLQQFGFSLREVQEIIDAPAEEKRRALERRAKILREEKDSLNEYIEEIEQMMTQIK